MLYPTSADALRTRRLIVLGAVTLFFAAALITHAVLTHRSVVSPASSGAVKTSGSAKTAPSSPVPTSLAPLQPTPDPLTFARTIAQALFGWDTATMVTRSDHLEQILKVGDPTGESTDGLLSDLDNYLPTPEAWINLAQYQTRQWLVIDSAETPTQWTLAEAQAGQALLPGTTALTIRGVRHRAGLWEGAPVATEHDVAFTIFMVCGPSYPDCHLLRLSMLDSPLN